MEGDAGASRLNPIGAQNSTDPEVGSTDAADQSPATEESVAAEGHSSDSSEPTDAAAETTAADVEVDAPSDPDAATPVAETESGEPNRLGRRWFAAICAGLLLLTAAAAVGGYLALRFHQDSEKLAAADSAAVKAAMECVAATQAPDTAAMAAGQGKILDCTTGDFGAQAVLFSGVLVDAFRAANVNIQVAEMRAAVEGHNPDGSVRVLVALRTKVTNTEQADREQGWRLRVQMAPVDGTYKISDLQQVTS